jgi:hypothetical protein
MDEQPDHLKWKIKEKVGWMTDNRRVDRPADEPSAAPNMGECRWNPRRRVTVAIVTAPHPG